MEEREHMESTFLHHQDTARCLWGPQHPGGWVEPLGNRAGLCREGGGRSGGQHPWGQLEDGGIHTPEEAHLPWGVSGGRKGPGVWRIRGEHGSHPPNDSAWGACWGLAPGPPPSKAPSAHRGPRGHRRGARRKRQAGWGVTLGEQISEVTGSPRSIQPRAACGGPKPDTPRTEALFCFCYWVLFHLPVVSYIYSLIYVNLLNLFGILCYCCYFIFSATLHCLQDLGSWARGQAWVLMLGVPSPNYWTNREHQNPGDMNQSKVSWRATAQHWDPALPNCLEFPVLETSGQTTRRQEPIKKKKRHDKKLCYRWKTKVKTCILIHEEEIGNLPEKEFRLMIVMIENLRNRGTDWENIRNV